MPFYISDRAWEALGGLTTEQRMAQGKIQQGGAAVKKTVRDHYHEWVRSQFAIVGDDALVELQRAREALRGRNEFASAMCSATFYSTDEPRYKRNIALPPEVVDALAKWAKDQRLWRRQRTSNPHMMAGLALEAIGRGWYVEVQRADRTG